MRCRALALLLLLAAALAFGCDKSRFTLGGGGGSPPDESDEVELPPGAVPVGSGLGLPSLPKVKPPALGSAQAMPLSFAPLAKLADPAVATVKSLIVRESRGRKRVVGEGLGTAFVYDPAGFLLTNNHVIEEATDIIVSFPEGLEYDAKVVGRDPPTDVAVLKVEATGLHALPLGDSDAVEVGDWVVAIGNPFGLSHTVSAGILSAKGRTRDDVQGLPPEGYYHFLQTDASINPGNSGGPLLNLSGEVVGVNAAVRANANNIGFAIPVNMVKQLLPRLLRDGKITRSAIGVEVKTLDKNTAAELKRSSPKGAWVSRLSPGGPAAKAGIAEDDVILAFEGQEIKDPNDLRWLASIHGVGRTAKLLVSRAGREFELEVTMGALPQDD